MAPSTAPRARRRLGLGGLAVALLASASPPVQDAPAPADPRPHILLVVVDDLGWQDTSLPLGPERTPFNERYRTPNVERLAREGLVHRQGYAAAPVCTPTRSALHTGRSPARSHVTYWTLHAGRDQTTPWTGGGRELVAPAWRTDGLEADEPTLAKGLRAAGYRTIHVGKGHLGAIGTEAADPRALGFDVNVAGHGPGGPGSFLARHGFRARARQGQEGPSVWDVPGLEAYHHTDVFLTEALAIEACRELRRALGAGERVFLHFAPYAVHAPIQANERYLAHYPDLDPREAAYATMVETVDHALGALLGTLEELGALDETLVVYTSDNGGLSAHARGGAPHVHNAPLRSGKGSGYEGGTRVPWVVRWPGRVAPGTVDDTPVISQDLYPTLLAAAGAPLDPARASELDGRDLTGLWTAGEPLDARVLLWHQPHFWGVHGPGIQPYSALRDGDWKVLWFQGEDRFELYDLGNDLGEAHDLSGERPEVLARLVARLREELAARGAQLPRLRGSNEAVAPPALVAATAASGSEDGR